MFELFLKVLTKSKTKSQRKSAKAARHNFLYFTSPRRGPRDSPLGRFCTAQPSQ